jgi:hypothetical protein
VFKNKLHLIGISYSENDQKENVMQDYKKTEKFAQDVAELVQKHTGPDNDTQIFIPENTVKDIGRKIDQPPEIKDDGKFHYRTDSELQQAIAQEKALKKGDLVIGAKTYPSHGKQAKRLFINQSKKDIEVELHLKYSHHDSDLNIFAILIESGSEEGKPIKLKFSEKLLESKEYLKLIEHAPFVDKNLFNVKATTTRKYSFNAERRIINTIKVTEILDFGLDYDKNSRRIWEKQLSE